MSSKFPASYFVGLDRLTMPHRYEVKWTHLQQCCIRSRSLTRLVWSTLPVPGPDSRLHKPTDLRGKFLPVNCECEYGTASPLRSPDQTTNRQSVHQQGDHDQAPHNENRIKKTLQHESKRNRPRQCRGYAFGSERHPRCCGGTAHSHDSKVLCYENPNCMTSKQGYIQLDWSNVIRTNYWQLK